MATCAVARIYTTSWGTILLGQARARGDVGDQVYLVHICTDCYGEWVRPLEVGTATGLAANVERENRRAPA